MRYCLDTDTCIYFLNNTSQNVVDRLSNTPFDDVTIPSMAVAELFFGIEKSLKRKHNSCIVNAFLSHHKIIHFEENSARIYGVLRAELEKNSSLIGGNDLVIAATAIAHDLILVTHNTKEFSRINQLRLEDWTLR